MLFKQASFAIVYCRMLSISPFTDGILMDSFDLDVESWAEQNFGDCDFNDKRLTKRLVAYAAAAARSPDDKTTHQTQTWKDCKGAYRFMDNEKVSFEKIVKPHCNRTKKLACAGVYLSICDTTEISFRPRRTIDGLRPVGSGTGQGFFLHTSLLVSDSSDEIIGIAGQELFYRIDSKEKENTAKRKQRERESEVWGRVVDSIGPPQSGAFIIHVCDREADDYDFFGHLVQNNVGWIVRASRLNRLVFRKSTESIPAAPAKSQSLASILDAQPSLGTYELSLRENRESPARIAKVQVRCANIWMPRPVASSPWSKQHAPAYIAMGVVEVREINVKKGVEPVHWVLYTHERVYTFEDGWRVISRYEKRPLIEEYHKAAKTGAQIEERYYRTAARLERIAGILSIVAVRILKMKTIAKREPNRLAKGVAPRKWIEAMCAIQRLQFPNQKNLYDPRTITLRDFLRGIAKLGGFLGRKSDGEPGWITIWRGVKDLLQSLRLQRALRDLSDDETCG
jgi:Transposase DNA-binding/Transposase Tn5 dimerisation domain